MKTVKPSAHLQLHRTRGSAMRLHFQEKPWDLYVAVGYAVATSVVLLVLNVGNFLAILVLLFVPGYVLVAALFPGNEEIAWFERIALSFGLSLAVAPLLGLLLNFTPWGIRFAPIVATLTAFTVLVGLAAYWRRMRLPQTQRLAATLVLATPEWSSYGRMDRILTIALIVSVILAAGTLAYVLLTPGPGERFTEFYILGPGGNASGYPTNLTTSQPGTLIVGIINHEAATVAYAVRVDLVGVTVVFNASCNCNQTQEVSRTLLAWLNQSLGDNQNSTRPFTFSINAPGLWKLQFLLYKDGALTKQKVQLLVRVT